MPGGESRRRPFGRARSWGFISFVVAAAVALAAPVQAETVLWVGGTGGSLGRLVPPGTFGTTDQLLGGAYKDDLITTVDYPGGLWPITGLLDPTLGDSVSTGTSRLEHLAVSTPGPLVIIGASQGALVAQRAAADLDSDPRVASDTTFILIADPNLGLLRTLRGIRIPILEYTPAALPETRFKTVVVINQYDGFADPIKRPWNLLTDLNAVMGIVYIHPTSHNTDLSGVPAANITTTVNDRRGTTTVYRVPAQQLPLTMPLRQLGVPGAVVDGIDASLRPIIDEGYLDPAPHRPSRAPASTRGVAKPPAPAAASAQTVGRTPLGGHSKAVGSSGRGGDRPRQVGP